MRRRSREVPVGVQPLYAEKLEVEGGVLQVQCSAPSANRVLAIGPEEVVEVGGEAGQLSHLADMLTRDC